MIAGSALQEDRSDVDIVRAIVASFCWRDGDLQQPVSTLAVQHELYRRGSESSASQLLRALFEVRDMQNFGHGYWLPSPTHVLIGENFCVVASGLPTQELRIEMPEIQELRLGLSRRLANEVRSHSMPCVSLKEWLGNPPTATQALSDLLRTAKFDQPLGMESAEIFRHWKARTPGRWVQLLEVPHEHKTVLGKVRSADGLRNFFYLMRIRAGAIDDVYELPREFDLPRLMCGLRATADDPLVCRIRRSNANDEVRLTAGIVPNAEQRFLAAIGRVNFRGDEAGVTTVRLLADAVDLVATVFDWLGFRIEKDVR